MSSITSVNAIYMLSVEGLYTSPQPLQSFVVDDLYDTPSINPAEIMLGNDGRITAGWMPVAIQQNLALLADSPSCQIFDEWYVQQQALREIFYANATITLIGLGKVYVQTRGVLTGYSPMADAKKVLQPRKFTITWESINPMPQ